MSNDLMSALQALDKEYGFSPVPDQVYHVTLGENSKPVEGKDGKNESYRFGWKIRCGAYAGRELGDFIAWFPKDASKTEDRDMLRITRGMTVQMLKAVAMTLGDDDKQRLNEAVIGLRNTGTPAEARGYFAQIATIAQGTNLYVRAATHPAKTKDPITGKMVEDRTKDGFQNVQYLEKGQPITAICACVAEAVPA